MKKTARKPVLAVTLGDPAGIGPEIVVGLFADYRPSASRAVIVGGRTVFERLAPGLARAVTDAEAPSHLTSGREVLFVDTGCRARYPKGKDSRGGGHHAFSALETACRLARAGVVDAIVTAPLSKRSLHMAGYDFDGHTEILARFFRSPDCQMVMVYRSLRIATLTRHIPVGLVAAQLTKARIVSGVGVINRALRLDFGIPRPRIAVAGLNPHAGEHGVIGREEAENIEPALRTLRRRGVRVTGPVPGDALFQDAAAGTFDAFVAMYHDQGLIPFKMVAKRRGVNVTVGLPIVRTSVDHGVAYDIVDRELASFTSLRAAYRLAENLARRRIMP